MFVEKSHCLGTALALPWHCLGTALALPGSRRENLPRQSGGVAASWYSHFGSVMKWVKWDNQCRTGCCVVHFIYLFALLDD